MIKQKLTFLNHSSFIIECDGYKVLVDPYIFEVHLIMDEFIKGSKS